MPAEAGDLRSSSYYGFLPAIVLVLQRNADREITTFAGLTLLLFLLLFPLMCNRVLLLWPSTRVASWLSGKMKPCCLF